MDRYYQCYNCPLYVYCNHVFSEYYGVPLLGRKDINDYKDCPIYRRCRKVGYPCILKEIFYDLPKEKYRVKIG